MWNDKILQSILPDFDCSGTVETSNGGRFICHCPEIAKYSYYIKLFSDRRGVVNAALRDIGLSGNSSYAMAMERHDGCSLFFGTLLLFSAYVPDRTSLELKNSASPSLLLQNEIFSRTNADIWREGFRVVGVIVAINKYYILSKNGEEFYVYFRDGEFGLYKSLEDIFTAYSKALKPMFTRSGCIDESYAEVQRVIDLEIRGRLTQLLSRLN